MTSFPFLRELLEVDLGVYMFVSFKRLTGVFLSFFFFLTFSVFIVKAPKPVLGVHDVLGGWVF